MRELTDKLAAFNAEMEAATEVLVEVSNGTLNLRNLLKRKAAEKTIMDAFADWQENRWEEGLGKLGTISHATLQAALEANASLKEKAEAMLGKITPKQEEEEQYLLQHPELWDKAKKLAKIEKELQDPKTIEYLHEKLIAPKQEQTINYLDDTLAPDSSDESYSEIPETIRTLEVSEVSDDSAEETEEDIAEEVRQKEGKQESFALNITLNPKQTFAAEMAEQGKSFCLIGAAGTGKTTAQRAVAEKLLLDGKLRRSQFKIYDNQGQRKYVQGPSIAFVAFTRRAAGNLKKAVHKSPILAEELEHNIMTVHALLEFEPETYQDYNEEGKLVDRFRFIPRRTSANPLDITHLVIEESSMLDAYGLWRQLYDALPSGVQIIFIGDINQLPPVFGPSVLNYALTQLPIVELTEVYRNQGIVLENAHNILGGKKLVEDSNFVIVRGKSQSQVGQAKMAAVLGNMFNQWLDVVGSDGLPEYDPDDCIILSPFNKQELGTINLNNHVAQHLGRRRNAVVHEVIAGFSKLYLAVGDRVMFNKMDGKIKDIYRNPSYHGKEPQLAGKDLTRFGVRILGEGAADDLDSMSLDYSTFSLEALEAEKAERKQQASHTVVVELDNGKVEELTAAGDFGEQTFSLGYALTVHKAQGSEWRKVFIVLHKDHATMLYRELFYTAVTRARTKVTIIAKDPVIEKAVKNQRIKGNTIADKIEFFNSGVMDNTPEPILAYKE